MIKLTVSKNKYGDVLYENEEGQLHNPYGPALVSAYGDKLFYLNGRQVTEEEHKRLTNPVREMTIYMN